MATPASSLLRQSTWVRSTGHHEGFADTDESHPTTVVLPLSVDTDTKMQQQPKTRSGRLGIRRLLQLELPEKPEGNIDDPSTPSNTTDDELFFDLYNSPCALRASNDAFSYQDFLAFGQLCNETFFGGCSYNDTSELKKDLIAETVLEWTIVFDYEIYYSNDPIPAIDHVESIILDHLSEITGLNGCHENETSEDGDDVMESGTVPTSSGRVGSYGRLGEPINDSGYRRNTKEYISEVQLSHILAISSDPTDLLDPDYDKCIVPVPSSISSNADCLPVSGGIHLYLNATGNDENFDDPNTKLSIQSGFQRLIRFGMQEGLYVSSDMVKHVSFIGTRLYTGDEAPPSSNLERDPTLAGGTTHTQVGGHRSGIIIGAVGAFVCLVLASVLLSFRSRNHAIAEASGHQSPIEGGDDTAVSSLPAGVVDDENPYLIAKVPLSVTHGTRDVPVVPSTVTAGTMDAEMEDDEETENAVVPCEQSGNTSISSTDDTDNVTIEELKIFHDDEEDEEDANMARLGLSPQPGLHELQNSEDAT